MFQNHLSVPNSRYLPHHNKVRTSHLYFCFVLLLELCLDFVITFAVLLAMDPFFLFQGVKLENNLIGLIDSTDYSQLSGMGQLYSQPHQQQHQQQHQHRQQQQQHHQQHQQHQHSPQLQQQQQMPSQSPSPTVRHLLKSKRKKIPNYNERKVESWIETLGNRELTLMVKISLSES